MQKRVTQILCLVVLAMLAAGAAALAQNENQEKPPVFTYVSGWVVPRAQWGDMAKMQQEDRAVEEKLLADGVLTSYGETENYIHTEDQPTHGSWMTATSEANILKALEAFYARPETTAPVLAASKHHDLFLVSRMYNGHAGTFDGAYLSGSVFQVKEGEVGAFQNLVKTRVVPEFEKLLADGTLASYNLDAQDFVTVRPGLRWLVFVAPNASALNKADQALEAAFGKDAELGPALGSLTVWKAQRDFLLRVNYSKAR